MLLLLGPAGCGKSTELLQLQARLQSEGYAVGLCACDGDMDVEQVRDWLISTMRRGLETVLLLDSVDRASNEDAENLLHLSCAMRQLGCRTVLALPSWLPGPGVDAEVLEVPTLSTGSFVRRAVARRVGPVFEPGALELMADASGGVVRDGLQLAASATRLALDEGVPCVSAEHVRAAVEQMCSTYRQAFGDDLHGARWFLECVRRTGQPPEHPAWRRRLLASGALLTSAGSVFQAHPMLAEL